MTQEPVIQSLNRVEERSQPTHSTGIPDIHTVREPQETLIHRSVRVLFDEEELFEFGRRHDDVRNRTGKRHLSHKGVDDFHLVKLVFLLIPVLPEVRKLLFDIGRTVVDTGLRFSRDAVAKDIDKPPLNRIQIPSLTRCDLSIVQ